MSNLWLSPNYGVQFKTSDVCLLPVYHKILTSDSKEFSMKH